MGAGFRDLVVWQKAMSLAERIYVLTQGFPEDERFGLTAQIRRAAVSIPSNIAEGYRRQPAQFSNYLSIAQGSCSEVETQLELATRLGWCPKPEEESQGGVIADAQEVARLIYGLRRSIVKE